MEYSWLPRTVPLCPRVFFARAMDGREHAEVEANDARVQRFLRQHGMQLVNPFTRPVLSVVEPELITTLLRTRTRHVYPSKWTEPRWTRSISPSVSA